MFGLNIILWAAHVNFSKENRNVGVGLTVSDSNEEYCVKNWEKIKEKEYQIKIGERFFIKEINIFAEKIPDELEFWIFGVEGQEKLQKNLFDNQTHDTLQKKWVFPIPHFLGSRGINFSFLGKEGKIIYDVVRT